jgi:hypothetical protein
MFMRHFGHGVGHLQYERQHEIDAEPNHDDTSTSMGHTLEDASDSSESDNLDAEDPDRVAVDSGEEEEEYGEIIDG